MDDWKEGGQERGDKGKVGNWEKLITNCTAVHKNGNPKSKMSLYWLFSKKEDHSTATFKLYQFGTVVLQVATLFDASGVILSQQPGSAVQLALPFFSP